MTHRTWIRSDYEAYLDSEFPMREKGSAAARESEARDRNLRMERFPHAVLLQVAYAEMDFANRWCWQQFGFSDGQCFDSQSEYPSCNASGDHEHRGTWKTHWYAKTEYNFGYNEWYFAKQSDRDRFVEYLPQVTWGEKYPK